MSRLILSLALLPSLLQPASSVELVIAGGVALRQWENLRGAEAHDKWWANFIRASTMHMGHIRQQRPKASINWIVYKPAYQKRSLEDGKPYTTWIEENAVRYGARLIWVSTTDELYDAINSSASAKDKITALTYFGHSNAYAFMLDYSCDIIGVSKVWIHQSDLATRLDKNIFAPRAECWSYGCYTGSSMSRVWREATGVPLWGNTKTTRYQPLSDGKMPEGTGVWVK